MKADLLDLLFDQRNKQYGAYQLRKTYARRLGAALLATIATGLLAAALVQPVAQKAGDDLIAVREVVLQNITELETPPPPPPPPPKEEAPKEAVKKAAASPAAAPSIKRTRYTPPVIVQDQEVKRTEVPPVDAITRVDVVDVAGIVDSDRALPVPAVSDALPGGDKDPGVLLIPQEGKEEENRIFEKVEVQARVNSNQWRRHLERRLVRYIEEAAYAGMPPGTYTVRVRFLVEKDGSIGRVKALNKPGYGLAGGAEQVVKTGPRWIAAEQNGRKVRSYHTQPITFVILES